MLKKLRWWVWTVALLAIFISGVASATAYIYRVKVQVGVTLKAGVPGMVVLPTTLQFGAPGDEVAIGEWSQIQVITVTNISTKDIKEIYLEQTPGLVNLYMITPPTLPLMAGQAVDIGVLVKSTDVATDGDYSLDVNVMGKR